MLVGTYKKTYLVLFLILTNLQYAYSQHDADSLKNILIIWNIDDGLNKKEILLEDTSVETFHKTLKKEKLSILTSNLGNTGSACISDIFIKRDDLFDRDFIFNMPYSIFIKKSKDIKYFNTRRPFTTIMHRTSTKIKNIQTISFIHSQNINPNFNIAFDFDFMTSLGQLKPQLTKTNSSALSINYKKNRYFIYASYVHNKIENENSGGFIIDAENTANAIPSTNLENAFILIKNQELSVTQKYEFGKHKNLSYLDTIVKVLEPKTSISWNTLLYRRYRIYTDKEQAGSKLYDDFNFILNKTIDSTSLSGVSNKISYKSEKIFEEKNKFGFSFNLKFDIKEYFNFKEYITLNNKNLYYEPSISADIYSNKFLNFNTKIFADYFISGYRRNDYKLGFNIKKEIKVIKQAITVGINAKITNLKPGFFFQNYYSNHYIWENDFKNTKRIDASLKFYMPKYRLKTSISTSMIENYIYFGPSSVPMQYDINLFVTTANINKTFNFRKFYFLNNIYLQQSSNENIVSVPLFALYHSAYFRVKYKNVLHTYMGYDVYFSTQYKASSFNPSVGQFYFEPNNSRTIGNYPFVGVFLNVKIKKNVMLSFKFQHINSQALDRNYPVQINNFPVFARVFRFSVRWTFKN